MKVYFIYHSCYAVELSDCILIFDYYMDETKDKSQQIIDELISKKDKHIYVLNSHFHGDHFSHHILSWAKDRKNISYILSKDIHVSVKTLGNYGFNEKTKPDIIKIKPDEDRRIGDIRVRTLKSTDEGVAYLVEAEGKTIYHAGDLNWWAWLEKGPEYVKHEGDIYIEQLEKIKGEKIDTAFVVLDSRLSGGFSYGMNKFFELVGADVVYPMHMWERFDIIKTYKAMPESKEYAQKVVDIEYDGQVF